MPIRKRTGDIQSKVENVQSETKHCPFCDNEIKAKAIKCQYCGEILDKKQNDNPVKKSTKEGFNSSAQSTIKAGKAVYRGYIGMFVWIGIAILAGMAGADFPENEGYAILDKLISLIPIILLMIWCNKTYGYLLNNNVKNLRFDSTGWPTRGWICPIACLFIPYQTVKDIYKTFNEECGIIGRWRACYLIGAVLLRLSGEDDTGFVALLAIGVIIAEYILIIKIVKNINNSLGE